MCCQILCFKGSLCESIFAIFFLCEWVIQVKCWLTHLNINRWFLAQNKLCVWVFMCAWVEDLIRDFLLLFKFKGKKITEQNMKVDNVSTVNSSHQIFYILTPSCPHNLNLIKISDDDIESLNTCSIRYVIFCKYHLCTHGRLLSPN